MEHDAFATLTLTGSRIFVRPYRLTAREHLRVPEVRVYEQHIVPLPIPEQQIWPVRRMGGGGGGGRGRRGRGRGRAARGGRGAGPADAPLGLVDGRGEADGDDDSDDAEAEGGDAEAEPSEGAGSDPGDDDAGGMGYDLLVDEGLQACGRLTF